MIAILIGIILLSGLMAFIAYPGHFEPMILLLGTVAASVLYVASSPSVREPLDAPILLAGEVRRLRQEVWELRQSWGATPCPSCRAALPVGARFCFRCGHRL